MSKLVGPEVEEQVGCNLIPMIDIMFLLLLFFMLSADMSQRELEDVTLPEANNVEDDKNEKGDEGLTNVNVFHSADGPAANCSAFAALKPCNEDGHWMIAIRGTEYTPFTIAEGLVGEADIEREEEAGPDGKRLSKRMVMIRADGSAPYEYIQRVMEGCSAAGIYKIELAAAKPMP
jgi:biopolymer transport protein ExbD